MRLPALFPVTFLLVAACAFGHPAEITPATLESGPRYQLTYVTLGSNDVDPKVVDQVAYSIQQELASRGLLLAAPWETPTLEVRFGLRGTNTERFDVRQDGFTNAPAMLIRTQPITYSRLSSDCDGSPESKTHCSEFDAASPLALSSAASSLQRRRTLGVEIRDIGTPHVRTAAIAGDDGEWTRGNAVRIRPLVEETIARLTL
jgi:hypothetical protein